MNKRFYIILLVLMMMFLVSCGDKKKEVKETPKPTESTGIDFEDLNPTSTSNTTSTPKVETTEKNINSKTNRKRNGQANKHTDYQTNRPTYRNKNT